MSRVAVLAVGACLDELDVVVAEVPEERLGALERAGVVVASNARCRFVDEIGRARRASPVERRGDLRGVDVDLGAAADAEHELRRVEHLDRETTADLHLAFVERGVGAGPSAGGPVAHRVGAVLLEQVHRRDDVALRLRHLLAIGVEDPARQRGVAPTARRRARSASAPTVEKSHVRMMSWPCGRRSIGNVRRNRSASSSHRHAICGVSDDVAHVSITSGSPMKPWGLPRCSSL